MFNHSFPLFGRSTTSFLWAILVGYAIALSQVAQADVCDTVDKVLVPSIKSEGSSRHMTLAFLKIINEDSFEQIKKETGASFGIPGFSGGGSYKDFSEKRNQLFKQEDYRSSEAEARSLLENGLPSYVVDSWKAVKLACVNFAAVLRSRKKLGLKNLHLHDLRHEATSMRFENRALDELSKRFGLARDGTATS
jgi:hypothetical protein